MDYKFIFTFGIFVCVLSSLPFMAASQPQWTGWRGKVNKLLEDSDKFILAKTPEEVRSAIPKYLIVKKPEGRKSLIKLNEKPMGTYHRYYN